MRQLPSRKWVVIGTIILLLASAVVVSRGVLNNQTSVSSQAEGNSLYTLTSSNSSTHFLVESGTVSGLAGPYLNGSAVIITPSNRLPDDGYYPKRTFVSYELSAKAGTLYTIFVFTNYDGRPMLFGGYEAFVHSDTSSIGTIIDFEDGESYNGTNLLSNLASVLTEGQIAIIFVPLNSSSFDALRVDFVQTTWGLLPFGPSGFTNEPISTLDDFIALSYMFILSIVIPVLASFILWRRFRDKRATPGLIVLLVAAAALRFGLAPVTGFLDTDNVAATFSTYFSSGGFGIDWVTLPGFLYPGLVSYLPYALLRTFGFADWTVLAHSTFAIETVFVKTPSILADLGVGLLLAKFAERFRPDLRNPVLFLYLFNPLTVYVSGVYGQYDSVFMFLFLASIYSFFVLNRPILTGFLLGATSLVNPVGFIVWIALLLFSTKARVNSVVKTYSAGFITFVAGLVPLFLQSNSVLLTAFERLLTAFPGDSLVGSTYRFTALGQLYSVSVGYGLTFRFLLELFGYYVGSYFYPETAVVAFLTFTVLVFREIRRGDTFPVLSAVLFCLGGVALFQFFFPTTFLQYVIWPFALLLCAYALSANVRYLPIAALASLLTGVLYVVFVDMPLNRATGVGVELLGDPRLVNALWAMLGLIYSALMAYIVILSIITVRRTRVSASFWQR